MSHRTKSERAKPLAPQRARVESTTLPAAHARGAVTRLKVQSVPEIAPTIDDELSIEEEPMIASEPRPPAISSTVLVDRASPPPAAHVPEAPIATLAVAPPPPDDAPEPAPTPRVVIHQPAPPIAAIAVSTPAPIPSPPARLAEAEDVPLSDEDLAMGFDGARRRRRGLIAVTILVVVILGGFVGTLVWSHVA